MSGEMPWLKSYPDGVRWDAPLQASHLSSLFGTLAQRWAERPALEFMGRRFSYAELHSLVERCASGLHALGVRPGVHVGLFLPNTPHYIIAFFAVLRAGGVVVNYSPLDAEKTLEHKVEDSQTDFMVTLDLAALYPQMARLLQGTRLKALVVGDLAEFSGAPGPVRAHLQQQGLLTPVTFDSQTLPFEQLVAGATSAPALENNDPFQLAVLQYTGGTTGAPKGAMLTHANLSIAAEQIFATGNGTRPVIEEGTERFLAVLPLFHIYALMANMLLCFRIGAEVVLHTRFDPQAVLKEIEAKRITVFPGVPTMFAGLIAHPDAQTRDLTSLKFCSSGGAPLPQQLNDDFRRLTGCDLVEGWGMTETSPTGTFTPVHGKRKAGSCGLPVPGLRVRFADVSDPSRDVPRGEAGELVVKGPNLMTGYWRKPEATRESLTEDGYFRTGDVGRMDEDGFIYLIDRSKDMILCSGYNVYPRNIEEAVMQHPAVAEVIVIGIDDEYRGQSPKAFVALKPGFDAFSLDDLKVFLADKLGRHEMVQALEIRKELPRTPVGKLSKKELYAEEKARRTSPPEMPT
ncbi:MAG TPA: long-chain fatty acid--CoA ligase [Ramlibacter sp.]|nr:long-chain fatty acid--CoA ligase [Ramlibacter sp.]